MWGKFRLVAIGVVLALGGVACSTKPVVLDYESYPKLPMTFAVKSLRFVAKNPLTRDAAFWGNYGGPGNNGGKPVDEMDEYFRQHDIAYLEASKMEDTHVADRKLIGELDVVEEDALSKTGRKFRKRAIGYFSSPISKTLGKPLGLVLGTRKGPIAVGAKKWGGK